jgi:hypothetical protein
MIEQTEQGRTIAAWVTMECASADHHQVTPLAANNIAKPPFHSLSLVPGDVLVCGNDYRADDERFHLAMDWLLRWCNENGVAVPHFGINDHAWALILRANKVARDRWPGSMLLVRIHGALTDAFTLPDFPD